MSESPRVICHMMSSVNGKILVHQWDDAERYEDFYETYHEKFDSNAWMCGRTTLAEDFTSGREPNRPDNADPLPREPFIGDPDAESFIIAVDTSGKLGWEQNHIDGEHIIEVLAESVDDAYLHYLREKKISYIFAGEDDIDLKDACKQLGHHFPIETIMLEGGGHINGTALQDGIIDELSLLLLPIADATPNTATTFELLGDRDGPFSTTMTLEESKQLDDGVLWLRYSL